MNLRTLREIVDAIKTEPAMGQCRFRVRNQWLDGGRSRTTAKDFYDTGAEQTARVRPVVVESDSPAPFKAGDDAMDPLELLLAAVGASFTATLVWHAAKRGIDIDAVDTRVEGTIDLSGCLGIDRGRPPGFEETRVSVRLEAAASESQLDRLVAPARRYSVVATRRSMALAERAGVDPVRLRDVMRVSSGANWYADNFDAIDWAREGYRPDSTIGILEKDVQCALDIEAGEPQPIDEALLAALRRLRAI